MTHEARGDASAAQSLMAMSAALARGAPAVVILRHIAREVQRVSGADTVAIYQLDADERSLVPVAGYHVPKQLSDSQRQSALPLSRWPAIAASLRDREPVGSNDARWASGVDAAHLGSLPPHSAQVIPMIVGGEPVGILYVAWWSPSAAMPASPSPTLSMLATSAGAALQSLLVGRDAVRKLQHTETLLAVSRALSSTLDLYSLMRHLLRWTVRTLGADLAGAYVLQEDGEWLAPLQGYRLPPDRVDALRRMKISVKANTFFATGAATGRAMFSGNVVEEPGIPEEIHATVPHRALIFVPIVRKDRLLGGLVAVWLARTPELQPADVALIESIAAQAGVVVENARLFEANSRQVDELSSLHDLARGVTGELERTTILRALHEPLRRGLAVDTMELYWRGPGQTELQLLFRSVDDTQDPDVPRALPAAGLAAVVAREGRPIRTRNADGHWLGVPALAGEEILGVLAVARRELPFTASDESFLGHAAQLVALALRSAALYDDQVRIQGLLLAQEHLMREERLRALGEMAFGVAHDFNNLLTAILGRAQLLQQYITEPWLNDWLRMIEQSALDGSHTVRRLQEFTRVRRDRPLSRVHLTQIVEDALTLTESQRRDAEARNSVQITVATELRAVPAILGAAPELGEAIANLILNAVDAMPQGGRLTLATAHEGDQVIVTISDTGVGMTEEVKRHVFDPFFTSKGPRGTGLGLSVTYGIVSRHGGQIRVDSAPGSGTTFTLAFPVAADAPAAESPAKSPAQAPRSLRCLVIDDEAKIVEVIRNVLQLHGHDVVTSDPLAALDHVESGGFDVVITDLAMPNVTGWQVAEAVKRRSPDVPVVLMSGVGVEIAAAEHRRQRIDAVLPKPISVDELLAAIATVAARRSS